MKKVYLSLGSNKGDREKNIKEALTLLQADVLVTAISPFIVSEPAEGVEGGFFLNGAVEIRTGLSPYELLKFLQKTENEIGRKFPHPSGKAREIDIDIIFYGTSVIRQNKLIIPHPAFRKRAFVLLPLNEIAPLLVDPETGKDLKSIIRELTCRQKT